MNATPEQPSLGMGAPATMPEPESRASEAEGMDRQLRLIRMSAERLAAATREDFRKAQYFHARFQVFKCISAALRQERPSSL